MVAEVPAQFAPDRGYGIGLERALLRVIVVDGLEQPHGRDLTQIFDAFALVAEGAGDTVRHGQPRLYDLLAKKFPLGPFIQSRKVREGGCCFGTVVRAIEAQASRRRGGEYMESLLSGRTLALSARRGARTTSTGAARCSRGCL